MDINPNSVRRHRETLGPISQNISSIPMPASAMKRSTSIANFHILPPSKIHKRTMSSVMGSGSLNASTNSGNNSTDALLQRRSSVYSARQSMGAGVTANRQSFFSFAPVPQVPVPDPRSLKNRTVQSEMVRELTDYLSRNNFEVETKMNIAKSLRDCPSQKEFNALFKWLYSRVDPSHVFQKGLDTEMPILLRQLRYPWEKSIMKSQITAVAPNNWPTFLGVLHWIMQLAEMMEAFAAGKYDYACVEAGYDIFGDRIIFAFLTNAYRDWLQVDEDDEDDNADRIIEPHVQEMAMRFDEANREHLEQVKILEAKNKELNDKIEDMGKIVERRKKLDETVCVLEEDLGKFEQYNGLMKSKVERYENRIKILKEETEKVQCRVREVEREKDELQKIVDERGLSMEDMDRMNAERERLHKNIDVTASKQEEATRRARQSELEAEAKYEMLESAVESYNTLGYQIAIIPSTTANANNQNFELTIALKDFDSSSTLKNEIGNDETCFIRSTTDNNRLLLDSFTGYSAHQVLSQDVRSESDSIRSRLQSLRKDICDRRNAALEKDMINQEMLGKVKETMDDKKTEVEALGHRVRAAEEEFEKTREITNQQKMASDAQIEKVEKELANMRAELTQSVQLTEQEEMNANLHYEQLTLTANQLREKFHTELARILDDVINFKVHVQKCLEEYEQFVAEVVEAECNSLESEYQSSDNENGQSNDAV